MEIAMAVMLLVIIPLKILELVVWNFMRVAEVMIPVFFWCIMLALVPVLLPIWILSRMFSGGGGGVASGGGGASGGSLSSLIDAFGGNRR